MLWRFKAPDRQDHFPVEKIPGQNHGRAWQQALQLDLQQPWQPPMHPL